LRACEITQLKLPVAIEIKRLSLDPSLSLEFLGLKFLTLPDKSAK
jgi:hypothetical protein